MLYISVDANCYSYIIDILSEEKELLKILYVTATCIMKIYSSFCNDKIITGSTSSRTRAME